MLLDRGFNNVKELKGGFTAWEEAARGGSAPSGQGSAQGTVATTQPRLGIAIGDQAVEFWLKDLNGAEVSLSKFLSTRPVVLEFGSYTSPAFRQQVAATEALASKYSEKVQFVIVYVVEPHPYGSTSPYSNAEQQSRYSYDTAGTPITQPETYEERVRMAALCARDAGITAPILVDEMNNPVWQVYGRAQNLAYFIGADGNVIEGQAQYDAGEMETVIERHLTGAKK